MDLDQALAAGRDGAGLRRAPVVDVADAVDAADGAVGRAAFGGQELALHVGGGVFGDRHAGVAALLGAVVHQAVLADVEVARTGAAAPVVGPPLRDRFLELVELRVVGLLPVAHLEVDLGLVVLAAA